jgi:hypothetical protein
MASMIPALPRGVAVVTMDFAAQRTELGQKVLLPGTSILARPVTEIRAVEQERLH